MIIIPVYVNDKLLAGNNDSLLDFIQQSISKRFKMSNLGTASWILGICIRHDITARTLFINQAQYIKGVLACFEMTSCMPVNIPLPAGIQYKPAMVDKHKAVSSYPYLEAIGSLMYAAFGT